MYNVAAIRLSTIDTLIASSNVMTVSTVLKFQGFKLAEKLKLIFQNSQVSFELLRRQPSTQSDRSDAVSAYRQRACSDPVF